MKFNRHHGYLPWAMACLTMIIVSSCRKQKFPDMGMEDKMIDYPAAYVVNGESGNLSVIRLSDNKVMETIDLMMEDNQMAMWPHHLSLYSVFDLHRLVVGVPGMDLSAGHSGGMNDMKGRVMVVDAVKGQVIKSVELPVSNHNAIYSPNGKEIWTSQMQPNGKVLVYDAQTYALKNTISVGSGPAEVTFSADGSKAYVANGEDNTVSIIDPSGKVVLATVPVDHEPVGAWVGHDGTMFVDNEEGQTISVLDVASNAITQTIPLGFMPGSASHHPVTGELWVTDPDNGKIHFYKKAGTQWSKAGTINSGAGAHAIAFTADGNSAYVTNQLAGSVTVIKVNDHSKITDIIVGKKPNGIVLKY